jgi:hypothetical protein
VLGIARRYADLQLPEGALMKRAATKTDPREIAWRGYDPAVNLPATPKISADDLLRKKAQGWINLRVKEATASWMTYRVGTLDRDGWSSVSKLTSDDPYQVNALTRNCTCPDSHRCSALNRELVAAGIIDFASVGVCCKHLLILDFHLATKGIVPEPPAGCEIDNTPPSDYDAFAAQRSRDFE